MPDPLPCPFCGGTAFATYGPGALIACRACGAYGPFCTHARAYTWDSRYPGPLTSHGYRPEHGDPLAWAAEQIEEAAATIRELRNDVGALTAANDTLVGLVRRFRDEAFAGRRGFLSRMFGRT